MRRIHLILASLFITLLMACSLDLSTSGSSPGGKQPTPPIKPPEEKINSVETLNKPIVVMISIDGFRADYMEKYKPKNLMKLAAQGAHAQQGMKPSFPSLTFPNHITLVTGRVPGSHGIVSNFFYDEHRQAAYQMSDDNAVHDGSWYRGEPIWSVAEKWGMLSKVCFWVGSEAVINGYQASEVIPYALAKDMTSADRANKIISWLKLPEEKKPHYIGLYYSDVDSAGHASGPNSPQVKAAIEDVDVSIGMIVDYVDQARLPVQFVIVSDHGMLEVKERINLAKLADFTGVRMMERGAVAQFYSDDDNLAKSVFQKLKAQEKNFKVYLRGTLPAKFKFDDPDRAGDFTVVGDAGYYVTVEPTFSTNSPYVRAGGSVATHGWDPDVPEMRALFIARGPMIKKGYKVPVFDNVDVYPLVLQILELRHEQPIDGDLQVLKDILAPAK